MFGSGKGYAPEGLGTNPYAYAAYANYGIVKGDTYVTVRDSIKDGEIKMSPLVHGNVYGGGEMASVGTYSTNQPASLLDGTGDTHVTVTGGTIGPLDGSGMNAYVLGGSQGRGDDPNDYYKYHATVGLGLRLSVGRWCRRPCVG